jgi:epoxyqueuosine reductase
MTGASSSCHFKSCSVINVKEEILRKARELGFDVCRVTSAIPPEHAEAFNRWIGEGHHGEMGYMARNAAKRVDPQKVLPGAQSVMTLAASYYLDQDSAEPQDSNSTGIIARYARFRDYHDVLSERLRSLTRFIDEKAGSDARSLWYVDTGPLLERDLAQRAGLGFIGKHTNLISRRLGNWFFISEIVTTVWLEPDAAEENKCGTCTRCIAACPTSAIVAPFQLDARRCISYLTIELKGPIPEALRPAIGRRIYGCDDCLNVCPWNRFAREGALMKQHGRADLEMPDLVELLSLDDAAFKRRFAGTPMLRTKRRGLLRNVCVALGNVGDESALPALQRASCDPEPLVVEHARWAIQQIESRAQAPLSRTAG